MSEKIAIIPVRWGSTRFPGKPLALILGKSLIQRTYENVMQSKLLDAVIVATDDTRILEHVQDFGGQAIMTSSACNNGSERVGEAAKYFPNAQIIVNVQGDEPCLSSLVIDTLVQKLLEDPEVDITTPVTTIYESEEIWTNHKVKCVFDKRGRAMYFSRSPIPHHFKKNTPIYLHIGVYAFRRNALFHYIGLAPTVLSQTEDLEQLRILEHGGTIYVCPVEAKSPSVDYPEDINKVEEYLCLSSASF